KAFLFGSRVYVCKSKRVDQIQFTTMKQIDCDICHSRDLPLNETIRIDGKVYCGKCFESSFPDQKVPEDRNVEKDMDPTVCSSCNKDFGDIELKKIAAYPICDECEVKIRNRAFPTWVKAFFAAIMVIVIVAFIWNWKFYQAYNDIQEANK